MSKAKPVTEFAREHEKEKNKKKSEKTQHLLRLIALPGSTRRDVRPTPATKRRRLFFSPHARDCKPANYQASNCIRQRARSGPDLRGIRQIWSRGSQGNAEPEGIKRASTFPPVDELVCSRRGRPAHGAAGLRRGIGDGDLSLRRSSGLCCCAFLKSNDESSPDRDGEEDSEAGGQTAGRRPGQRRGRRGGRGRRRRCCGWVGVGGWMGEAS